MTRKGKLIFIISAIVLGSIAVSLIDGVIRPEYIFKCMAKISVFPLLPLIYLLINRKDGDGRRRLFLPDKKGALLAIILGLGVFTVVMGAYLILSPYIDFSSFADNLTGTAKINSENYIFVTIYICIINSFMEEFFFRGLAFLEFKKVAGRPAAYVFSALMFALYHTGMTGAFVDLWVFLLMLLGLFLGGIVFNFVDEKAESIFPSHICHFFANLATCAIGWMMIGI